MTSWRGPLLSGHSARELLNVVCTISCGEFHFSSIRASLVSLVPSRRAQRAVWVREVNVSWRKSYTKASLLKIPWLVMCVFVGWAQWWGRESHRTINVTLSDGFIYI